MDEESCIVEGEVEQSLATQTLLFVIHLEPDERVHRLHERPRSVGKCPNCVRHHPDDGLHQINQCRQLLDSPLAPLEFPFVVLLRQIVQEEGQTQPGTILMLLDLVSSPRNHHIVHVERAIRDAVQVSDASLHRLMVDLRVCVLVRAEGPIDLQSRQHTTRRIPRLSRNVPVRRLSEELEVMGIVDGTAQELSGWPVPGRMTLRTPHLMTPVNL